MAPARTIERGEAASIVLGDDRWIELRDVLGWGDSATVYRARLHSAHVSRPVALKLFTRSSTEEAELVFARLAESVRRIACIDHPNVVRLYECGETDGHPFVVTELVDGPTLSAYQDVFTRKRRRLPLDLGLFIASEVAEALSAARLTRGPDGVQLNVVHHAVSPRDVLLSQRGEVKVTDFEASCVLGSTSSVRSLRGVASQLSTMAPEVVQGAPPDARSDVFSLGVLLRELFVGPRFPVSLTSSQALRLAREGYVEPITFQPQLPAGLVAVMTRALEVEPEHRYANATQIAFDLRRESLAMGVGDGRYFLRASIERDWTDTREEITAEHFAMPANDALDEPTHAPAKRRR